MGWKDWRLFSKQEGQWTKQFGKGLREIHQPSCAVGSHQHFMNRPSRKWTWDCQTVHLSDECSKNDCQTVVVGLVGAAAACGLVWVSHRPAPGTSGLAANPDSERPKSQTLRTVWLSGGKKGARLLSGQTPRHDRIAANQDFIYRVSVFWYFGVNVEKISDVDTLWNIEKF